MKELTANKYSLLDVFVFQGTAIIILTEGSLLNAVAFTACGFIVSSLLKD